MTRKKGTETSADERGQGAQGRTKSLWRFYEEASESEFQDPQRTHKMLDEILPQLGSYGGPPELWHNTAMTAARVKHHEAELGIVLEGLRQWPENVDLLCDELQYRHTSHYDPERAQAIFHKLTEMQPSKTSPCWRFWVYRATYLARELHQPAEAIKLLDAGLLSVTRDSLMDVLRAYRMALVDSVPVEKLQDETRAVALQKCALDQLESRYKRGMALGLENGHVLAWNLARLYQERAGAAIERTLTGTSTGDMPAAEAPGQDVAMSQEASHYLQKALQYLDLAEQMYTGNPNHPIWEIYVVRIGIFMAQRKYGDALRLLRSVPEAVRLGDPSLQTMLRLAALSTGEPIEQGLGRKGPAEAIDMAIGALFASEGALLLQIAQQNPNMQPILARVLQQLDEEGVGQGDGEREAHSAEGRDASRL